MPVAKTSTKPSAQELFSGTPREWSPYDIDARYLRWGSLGFGIVPKGEDAQPKIRSIDWRKPNDLDREKLWRLMSACGVLQVEYERPTYGNQAAKFVFARPRERKEMPPFFADFMSVFGFTHELKLALLESRTGRGDLVVSCSQKFIAETSKREEEPQETLDISDLNFGLRCLSSANHLISRPLIGSPHLAVFQNIAPGASYEIVVERPSTPARLSPGDIVFVEPTAY